MKTDPYAAFSSHDRFERLLRLEVAELLNDSDLVAAGTLARFSEDDGRLTDEVCYTFVNAWSETGDVDESATETFKEHPEIWG